tara:strand:+ start:13738 stop:17619 length:3882 start_codon:yes stop_codon:yes gene_type:complete
MSDMEVGVRLKADGSGLVGEFELTKEELEKLNKTLKKTEGDAKGAAGGLDDLGRKGGKASQSNKKLKRSLGEVRGELVGLKSMLATLGLGLFIRDATKSALALDSYNRALKFGAGGASKMALEQEFLRKKSTELGLVFQGQISNYSKLTAASRGTAIQGNATREIWLGMAEASTVLGLSQEQQAGALTAIEQIMSKGKVQAEELRGQLGERLPGAFQIASRAMGKTTEELSKMLDNGELLSEDFLPKFVRQLREEVAPSLAEAMNSPQAELNRFANDWIDLKNEFGTGFLTGLTESAGELGTVLRELVEDGTIRELGEGLGDIAHFAAENIDMIELMVIGYGSYKLAALALAPVLGVLTKGQIGLNIAMRANPIGLIATAISGLVVAYQLLSEETDKTTEREGERLKQSERQLEVLEKIGSTTRENLASVTGEALADNHSNQISLLEDRKRLIAEKAALEQQVQEFVDNPYPHYDASKTAGKARQLEEEIKVVNAQLKEAKSNAVALREAMTGRGDDLDEADVRAQLKAAATARKEIEKLEKSYLKLTSSLDPVLGKSREYNSVVEDLALYLDKGLIPSQEEYNRLLDLAQQKYYPTSISFLQEQAKLMEEEIYLLGLSEEQRQIEIKTRDLVNASKQKGLILDEEEIQTLREISKAHVEAINELEKRRAAEEEAAEAIKKVWENARENVQKNFADFFDEVLQGNLDSVGDFWDSFKAIGRRAIAETLTAELFQGSIGKNGAGAGGILGLFGLGGSGQPGEDDSGKLAPLEGVLNDGLKGLEKGIDKLAGIFNIGGGSAGAGGAAGAAGGAAGLMSTVTTIAAPLLAGSILGDLLGIDFDLGATGTLLGAGAGFLLGGPLGALAGGLFGSLFNSTDIATQNISGSGGQITSTNGRRGGDANVEGANTLANSAIDFYNAIEQITGSNFSGNLGSLGIRDDKFIFEKGSIHQRFDDAEQAVEAQLKAALSGGNIDLSDTFKTIMRKSISKGAEQLLSDLEFGKIFDDLVNNDTLSKAEKQLTDLADTFKEVGVRAKELGLDASKVTDAFIRETNRLRSEFNETIDLSILEFENPLEAALRIQYDAQAERLEEARALGADLVDVERLNMLEREQLIKRFADSASSLLGGLHNDIEGFALSLGSGSKSQLAPADQLSNAETRFNDLLGLARGGDEGAINDIVAAAEDLRVLSLEVFSSSEQYFTREAFILEALRNLENTLGYAQGGLTAGTPAATIENVFPDLAGGFDQVNDTIIDGNNKVAELLAEIRDLLGGPQGGQFIREGGRGGARNYGGASR